MTTCVNGKKGFLRRAAWYDPAGMPELLDSATIKIERARSQIDELDAHVREFFADDPYEYFPIFDSARGIDIWTVKLKRRLPRAFPALVGECLHNLRSSLDNIACAIAQQHTGSTKGTAFPFGATEAIFEQQLAKKGKRLPPDAAAMIRTARPYKQGDEYLWALNDLNRGDKHHVGLTPALVQMQGTESELTVRNGTALTLGSPNGRHLVRDEQGNMSQTDPAKQPMLDVNNMRIVLTFPPGDFQFLTTTIGAAVQLDFQVSFTITLGGCECLEGQPVAIVLNQMHDRARQLTSRLARRFFP